MNILLLGPPGSGKSTQAALLAERLGIPRITASEVLTAAADTEADDATLIRQAMESGSLVPDEAVSRLLIARLRQADCAAGFVLDGFPRTVRQAAALEHAGIRLDSVIELTLEEADLLRRLTGRRIHEPSGRTYHLLFAPPKADERDDVTGEALTQRVDDREEVVRRRLTLYREAVTPLRGYYRDTKDEKLRYVSLSGTGSPSEVFERMLAVLRRGRLNEDDHNDREVRPVSAR